jgi:hypothetical protein
MLRACGCEIRAALQPVARSAGARGDPSLSIHLTSIGASWAGFNVAVCALRFFYGVTLGRTAMVDRIPYARKRRQLPVILSADEIARFLAAVPSLKHRTALMTAYAAGLRVSEVVHLKLTDIDSGRMLIRVEQGKGGRDRYIMLSPQLLIVLRAYWRETRPAHWWFPGQDESRPLDASVLQWACRNARAAAKLGKLITVHTLRHSFATHLRAAPGSCGCRCRLRAIGNTASPFDRLKLESSPLVKAVTSPALRSQSTEARLCSRLGCGPSGSRPMTPGRRRFAQSASAVNS